MADKRWRPRDWDALDIYAEVESIGTTATDYIEAGADAMTEGLYATANDGWLKITKDTEGNYVLYFDRGVIPDKEAQDEAK